MQTLNIAMDEWVANIALPSSPQPSHAGDMAQNAFTSAACRSESTPCTVNVAQKAHQIDMQDRVLELCRCAAGTTFCLRDRHDGSRQSLAGHSLCDARWRAM